MSRFEKENIFINLFDKENEMKGNMGTGKLFAKKLEILSEDTKNYNPFNTDNVTQMMKNEEVKAIIHDFYESQQVEFDLKNIEAECRHFMWKLEIELASKDENKGLDDKETILFFILLNDMLKSSTQSKREYSEHLVNEFKDVLKEITKYFNH